MHRRSLRIQHKAIWEGRIEKLVVEEMLQEILLWSLEGEVKLEVLETPQGGTRIPHGFPQPRKASSLEVCLPGLVQNRCLVEGKRAKRDDL